MSNGKVNVRGNVVGSTINLGEILGNVTNTVNQVPATAQQNGVDLKPLLEEMLKLIRESSAKGVDEKTATKAAKNVEEIAKAGKEPANGGLLENAERAWDALKGLAATSFVAAAGAREQIEGVLHKIGAYFGWAA